MTTDARRGSAWGLDHQFDSLDQQRESSFLGMWIFLVTEIMFFGGLFTAYSIYRGQNTAGFTAGSHELDIGLGAFNTVVLIGSSLTMAMAVWAAQTDRRKATVCFILATILLGSVFLGVKVVEYDAKFEHHLFPGPEFQWPGPERTESVEMFFNLYFLMTGLHALHMIIGIGILAVLAWLAWRGVFSPQNHNLVEGVGLYWHFVDIVWIFLFPLLYLLGRNVGAS
jgi:cytochrome c oxidase subunit 3